MKFSQTLPTQDQRLRKKPSSRSNARAAASRRMVLARPKRGLWRANRYLWVLSGIDHSRKQYNVHVAVVKNTFSGIFFKEKRTLSPLYKWILWFGTKFPRGILTEPSKCCSSGRNRVKLVTVIVSSGDTSSDTHKNASGEFE